MAPNLLARNFTAPAPDQVWGRDITYLACEEGWEYLGTVMDLYSRRIVGWAMQSTLERSLTLRALEMAIAQRRPAPRLIHHSDRGVQYARGDYQTALNEQQMIPSMSRKGDCWDNVRVSKARRTTSRAPIRRLHCLHSTRVDPNPCGFAITDHPPQVIPQASQSPGLTPSTLDTRNRTQSSRTATTSSRLSRSGANTLRKR